MPSAYPMPLVLIPSATGSLQLYDPISFTTLSALGCALPVLLPTNLFCRESSNEGWRLSRFLSPINRRLIFLWLISLLSLLVAPYSISPSLYILTGYGVNVFVNWLLLYSFKGAGKLFTRNSSSRCAFNALDKWRVLIGFASNEGFATSSPHFHSIYKRLLFLISPISSLLIFERERLLPWILSAHSLLSSACPLLPLKPFF